MIFTPPFFPTGVFAGRSFAALFICSVGGRRRKEEEEYSVLPIDFSSLLSAFRESAYCIHARKRRKKKEEKRGRGKRKLFERKMETK